jgi:negative regulator of sigma E activity
MAHDELGPADIDRLADYIGGALDGPDEAEVARLVAEDPRWRDTYHLLAPGMRTVAAELQTIGAAAEPMPADVAVRLDEALAAEPRRHLSVVPGSSADDDAPVVTSRPRRRLRWAVPVAAAAGVLAFAGFGVDYLINQNGGSADQATSAAGNSSAERAAPMMGADDAGAAPQVRDDQVRESGTNYTIATLAGPPAPFAASDTAPKAASPDPQRVSAMTGSELAGLRAPAALQACIDAIAQINGTGPITVETVDYARYDDRPAIVVRFTAAGATWAYAAGPKCGTPERGADLIQRVQVR